MITAPEMIEGYWRVRTRMGAWRVHAACRGADPELFFPAKGDGKEARAAKAICAGCPVRVECLDYAVENCEKYGIFGGLSERQRRKVRRERYGGLEHGTSNTYKTHGCRCDACQEAQNAYQRKYRAERAAS